MSGGSHCPHVTGGVGRLASTDLAQLLANPACDICRRGPANTNLWLCLYPDCYMLGCAEQRNDHSTQHQTARPDHCLQLNVSNRRAWCYACKSEVVLSNNKPSVLGVLGHEPARSDQGVTEEEEEDEAAGLVGLSNLGNTCYMNSALQCLSNTPALTKFFLNCPDLVPRDVKPALGQAYGKLMVDLWQLGGAGRGPGYVAPSGVLHAIKQAWPAFRGFQQHDAQEFLRCCMDQLHKELSQPVEEEGEEQQQQLVKDVERESVMESLSEQESNSGTGSEQGEEYETAESGLSDFLGAEGISQEEEKGSNRKRKMEGLDQDSGLGSISSGLSSGVSSSKFSRVPGSASSLSDQEFCDATSDSGGGEEVRREVEIKEIKRHRARRYRSIVTDIFDGALVSSVKCLTCDTVSKTCETFQDLSLPIPSMEAVSGVRLTAQSQAAQQGWVGWAWDWITSWFYGPDVSLMDCLAYFFSADELKGDNMYSCDKCKKLRNGLKYSQVTTLPDTLCIHLKRFRHDFAFSSKISTRVSFPLVGLDMEQWVHPEYRAGRKTNYSLTGVVCHHGTAGGGHYTCYCRHPVTGNWYEYDDSLVRQVDSHTVINSEAYVLFYRKDSEDMEWVREEVGRLAEQHCQTDSLVRHHIANSWLAKFYTVAEPGPIDNSSVLCRHGGVLPHRVETAASLCTAVPPAVWSFLHARFGGSAAVTRLQVCQPCLSAARAEMRQKEFELAEFKLLHAEEGGETDPGGDRYCLTATWFRAWEAWVCGRAREPPGPVNNRSIIVQRPHGPSLRPHTDHFKFSEDIWSLFLSLYGGGPEVVLPAAGGGVRVSAPRPASLARLKQRLRLRSCSQQEEVLG